jgi:hypothetical protein
MPVISTRRYSSYLTSPSSTSSSSGTSSSGIGSYRSSNYSSLSSTSSSTLPSSRYNFGDTSSYRTSSYRTSSSLTPSTANGASTYRSNASRYTDYGDDNSNAKTRSDSLSTRIGVSNRSSRFYNNNNDTLPPLPPNALTSNTTINNNNNNHHHHHHHNHHSNSFISKRSLSRSRDQSDTTDASGVGTKSSDSLGKLSLMDDLEFYEKYSPSRYMTKYELARSQSLSEGSAREISPASSTASLNVGASSNSNGDAGKSEVNRTENFMKKKISSYY